MSPSLIRALAASNVRNLSRVSGRVPLQTARIGEQSRVRDQPVTRSPNPAPYSSPSSSPDRRFGLPKSMARYAPKGTGKERQPGAHRSKGAGSASRSPCLGFVHDPSPAASAQAGSLFDRDDGCDNSLRQALRRRPPGDVPE